MYDDKCPTCPNYGGFCDCGTSKYNNNGCLGVIGILVLGIIAGAATLITIAELI